MQRKSLRIKYKAVKVSHPKYSDPKIAHQYNLAPDGKSMSVA
jgi:hypothetical protein